MTSHKGCSCVRVFFFFQAEDGIRDYKVTGVQTCALPISMATRRLDTLTGEGPSALVPVTIDRSPQRALFTVQWAPPARQMLDLDVFPPGDRKSTRLNSSHLVISYAVFCLKKKKNRIYPTPILRLIHNYLSPLYIHSNLPHHCTHIYH